MLSQYGAVQLIHGSHILIQLETSKHYLEALHDILSTY